MSAIKVSARRNFKDYPFTPMMNTQSKFQVEKKIIDILGEVYGDYTQLSKISDETKAWLEFIGIDISRKKSHDSAGINDDWPKGRGVFIDNQREFAVLVNFEDHIQVVSINEEGDVNKCLGTLLKVLSKFEKAGYARHTTLGFLTASPKNLGTTLKLSCDLSMKQETEKELVESLENTYS